MSWNSIINQKKIKRLLLTTLEQERLAHAYLFSGPSGVGKDAIAIELAKVVNCERQKAEACDICNSCKKIDAFQHPNVNLVFALPAGKGEKYGDSPMAKLSDDEITLIRQQVELKARNSYYTFNIPRANGIKINSIREIKKEAALTAFEKGKKVFIIIGAENLSDESSNALLKTLEEPHQDTLLILTTSQPESLLPTIISRCQHIRFDSLGAEEIHQALMEREGVDSQQAAMVATVARGSYSRALALTDSGLNERRSEAINFLRMILFKTRQDILGEIERLSSEYEKSEIDEFLLVLQAWLHSAMTLSEGYSVSTAPDEMDALQKFVAHHPRLDYASSYASIDKAISLLDKNVYIPLILLNLAMELQKTILPFSKAKEITFDGIHATHIKGVS